MPTLISTQLPQRNASGGVDLRVTFAEFGEVPFTASPLDEEAHGRELYARAEAGDFGAVAPYTTGLEDAKAAKIVQIEADRNAACVANATAHTRQWQADTRSQALLGQAITLASAGLPLPPEWRDADNSNMPVTSLADLLAIAGAIAVQVQSAYSASWARKAAVEAATTLEDVAAA